MILKQLAENRYAFSGSHNHNIYHRALCFLLIVAVDSVLIHFITRLVKIRRPFGSAVYARFLHILLKVSVFAALFQLARLYAKLLEIYYVDVSLPVQYVLLTYLILFAVFAWVAPRAYAIMFVYAAPQGKSFLASLLCAILPGIVLMAVLSNAKLSTQFFEYLSPIKPAAQAKTPNS